GFQDHTQVAEALSARHLRLLARPDAVPECLDHRDQPAGVIGILPGLCGTALLQSEPGCPHLESDAAACPGDHDLRRAGTLATAPGMVDHAHDPAGASRHDYHPVLAFVLGQSLGERGGINVRGLPGEVPQEVDLVDAAVDQHPAAVQVAAAAPVAGLERGLLAQLHHAKGADTALR